MGEVSTSNQPGTPATSDQEYFKSFFKDEESMIIFALLHLDMEIRTKLLGINDALYESKKDATSWYRKMRSKIHPDRSSRIDDANKAMSELQELYDLMKNSHVD